MKPTKLLRKTFCCAAAAALLHSWALAANQPPFFLTDCNGALAVWDSRKSAWIQKTQIPLDVFSPQDQALLQKGIALYSQQELAAAMEDFCS